VPPRLKSHPNLDDVLPPWKLACRRLVYRVRRLSLERARGRDTVLARKLRY
jgi:hypothetical protein